jgi:hypothetical protein
MITISRALLEVAAERAQQDDKWGEQNHPDGTGQHLAHYAAAAQRLTDSMTQRGRITYRHILDEEVREAFAESDRDKLRAELIQVAAVAVAWIEKLDREVAAA